MAHRLKGHTFNALSGRMGVHERYFPSFEAAIEYALQQGFDHFKIFDHNEQMVHSATSADTNTYA